MKVSARAWMVFCRPAAWVPLFVALVVPVAALPVLPDEIPRHYDLAGNVDATGPKLVILTLPLGVLLVYGLLTAMQLGVAHLIRMQRHTGGTPAHPSQIRAMLQAAKALTAAVFAVLTVRTVATALDHPDLIAPWIIWIPMGLVLLTPLLQLVVAPDPEECPPR